MKYEVTLTRIYNGRLEVEAASSAEAMDIAKRRLEDVEWNYGEETVDYATKMDD